MIVGDYAILIHAGFSKVKALLLNFLTALSALLGTIIGVIIGTSFHDAEKWILAFIAGRLLPLLQTLLSTDLCRWIFIHRPCRYVASSVKN